MKRVFAGLSIALLCAIAPALHAQTGCVDSPEDPTIVLAVLGSGGALIAGFRKRKRDKPPRGGGAAGQMRREPA